MLLFLLVFLVFWRRTNVVVRMMCSGWWRWCVRNRNYDHVPVVHVHTFLDYSTTGTYRSSSAIKQWWMYSREHQCTGISYYKPYSSYIPTSYDGCEWSCVGCRKSCVTRHIHVLLSRKNLGLVKTKLARRVNRMTVRQYLSIVSVKNTVSFPTTTGYFRWNLKQGELTLRHLFSGNCVFEKLKNGRRR